MDCRQFGFRGTPPHEKSASECIRVVPQPAPWRQLAQYLRVAAAEHDIVRLQGGDQPINHVKSVLPPIGLLPVPWTGG